MGASWYYEGLRWGFGRSGRDGTDVEFGFWVFACMVGVVWRVAVLSGSLVRAHFSYDGLLPVTNGVLEHRRGEY